MPKELVVILPLPETTGSPYSGGRHVVVFAQTPGLGKVLDVALRPVPGFPTNPPAVATVH
jgi:hypothetical protein